MVLAVFFCINCFTYIFEIYSSFLYKCKRCFYFYYYYIYYRSSGTCILVFVVVSLVDFNHRVCLARFYFRFLVDLVAGFSFITASSIFLASILDYPSDQRMMVVGRCVRRQCLQAAFLRKSLSCTFLSVELHWAVVSAICIMRTQFAWQQIYIILGAIHCRISIPLLPRHFVPEKLEYSMS